MAGVEQTPKSGKVRSVPLMDQAATALAQLSHREHFTADTDLVFPSPTGHYLTTPACGAASPRH